MARQVYKQPIQQGIQPANPAGDSYNDRLVKMIPSDVVALYLACNTAVSTFHGTSSTYWIVFFFILLILPFYLKRIAGVTETMQIVVMTINFVLWCSTLDQPFDFMQGDSKKLFSTISVALFTFAVPIIYRGK